MKQIEYFLLLLLIFAGLASCKKESNEQPLKFIGISQGSASYNSTITIYADNFPPDKDGIKLN